MSRGILKICILKWEDNEMEQFVFSVLSREKPMSFYTLPLCGCLAANKRQIKEWKGEK